MELKSPLDFKSIRKAQSKTMKTFNRAVKALEGVGLDADESAAIEAILTKKYNAQLEDIMKNGAPVEAKDGANGFV